MNSGPVTTQSHHACHRPSLENGQSREVPGYAVRTLARNESGGCPWGPEAQSRLAAHCQSKSGHPSGRWVPIAPRKSPTETGLGRAPARPRSWGLSRLNCHAGVYYAPASFSLSAMAYARAPNTNEDSSPPDLSFQLAVYVA